MKIKDLEQIQSWNDELESESIRICSLCDDNDIISKDFTIEQVKVENDCIYVYFRYRSDWDLESYSLPFFLFEASDKEIQKFWQKKSNEKKKQEEKYKKSDLAAEKAQYLILKKKFEKE